ncbi:hypothetical protein P152DRAFT_287686 [Eremomyces bilateralis CBS 781.70]|uniref:Zn(2)-C6 fungal-type domain-containing protein n=1 Tax=Eremomyces bilateralis CBS 781.70 TaxID=1392243 RepID=A0A6G1G750_9PEZI|nr:uncharacterized protein P152DRAFT_287686 [Eremomyces bilateralis CBS 781.70]KAF1813659.1 hypothetical protein P152DRAFT_287686 [Eremomyces bilateralis CBS 781.70]
MAPTPPSTTPSSTGQSPDAQFRVVRKRNRIPLSCAPCRNRKLKCNRAHPCDNCTKRGDLGSCTYANPGVRKKTSSSNASSGSPDEMQSRIDRLEGLVLSLMTNGTQSAGSTAAHAAISESISGSSQDAQGDLENSEMVAVEQEGEENEVDQVGHSIGMMKIDKDKAVFASESHWYAILGEIAEVKNYFNDHKKQYEEQVRKIKATNQTDDRFESVPLLGTPKPSSKAEILSAFPQKPTADLLVTRYFNTYDPALHIIHGPTFQRQYDQYWANPNETPVIWLGLVFAMMSIALQSYHRAGDEPPEYRGRSWNMSNEYRRLTAQCLVFSDITQPITHMLETLVLHVHAEHSRSNDAEPGILVTVSILVRLAMRMGYHRDPAPYPNVTPFQGEMRRRVWAVIRNMDLLFSNQAGLPPIVRSSDTNTELPLNVYDDELDEQMKTLPIGRPMREATPATYMIQKTRLVALFGTIVDVVQTLNTPAYEEIMKLDQRVRELKASIPPHLVARPIAESGRDPSSLIMQRCSLDFLVLRCLCVLHRRYMRAARSNPRFAHSRRVCVDASLDLLKHQAVLQQETHPGGRLASVTWFISSLTMNEFLMAAMTVALDLYHTSEAECAAGIRLPLENPPKESCALMTALEQSLVTWDSLKDRSVEAYKAYNTLSATIPKLKTHCAATYGAELTSSAGAGFATTGLPSSVDAKMSPDQSAAMTLGMLSAGGLAANSGNTFYAQQQPPFDGPAGMAAYTGTMGPAGGMAAPEAVGVTNPFSSLFGPSIGSGFPGMEVPSANLNWDQWDTILQNPPLDSSSNFWPGTMDLSSGILGADSSTTGAPTTTTSGVQASSVPEFMRTNAQAGDEQTKAVTEKMFPGAVFRGGLGFE